MPPEYDNLIAKLMVHAGDRDAAIERLRRALDEAEVGGIQTTVPFHAFVARDEAFRAGRLSTGFVPERWEGEAAHRSAARSAQLAAALDVLEPASVVSLPDENGSPVTSGSAVGRSGRVGDGAGGAWRRAGRAAGRNRWPM